MRLIPKTGLKAVAAAGTPERAAASRTPMRAITFIADPDNLGNIYLGNSASQPLELTPGQSWSVGVNDKGENIDPYDFYVDADTTGEAVNYLGVAQDFPER